MSKLCINVDDVGMYKMHRLAPWLGMSSNTVNTFLKIPLAKTVINRLLDIREFMQTRTVKKVATKFGAPISWAIVPFKVGLHSPKTRFDKACPEIYRIIKKYVAAGDEVIQHGAYHSADEFTGMPFEEQKKRLQEGWEAMQAMFPGCRKIIQIPKWKADNNTIKALEELGYEAVLASNVLNISVGKLKTTRQIILTKIPLNTSFFNETIPVNIILHANHPGAIDELYDWLDFGKILSTCEFVKCSEAIK